MSCHGCGEPLTQLNAFDLCADCLCAYWQAQMWWRTRMARRMAPHEVNQRWIANAVEHIESIGGRDIVVDGDKITYSIAMRVISQEFVL